MSRTHYSEETKAAVMAALLQGQSVSAVADAYEIPISTVSNWKNRNVAFVSDEKKEEIGDLLLQYMHVTLETMIEQVKHFRDREWLGKQSAESLAVLHGVQTDKLMKMLEALNRAESSH